MAKLANLELLVADFIRITPLPAKKYSHPVVITFVGAPFSGKTMLTAHLAKKLPLAVVSEASIGSYLAPRATFFKRGAEEIFMLASKAIEELVKQKVSIIYDASIKKRADRAFLRDLVTKAGGKLVLIQLILQEGEAYERMQRVNTEVLRGEQRGFIMDKDFFRYELNTIENPTPDENPLICNAQVSMDREKIENHIQTLLAQ